LDPCASSPGVARSLKISTPRRVRCVRCARRESTFLFLRCPLALGRALRNYFARIRWVLAYD
jgi:hypothetical protein